MGGWADAMRETNAIIPNTAFVFEFMVPKYERMVLKQYVPSR